MAAIEQVLLPKSKYQRLVQAYEDHMTCLADEKVKEDDFQEVKKSLDKEEKGEETAEETEEESEQRPSERSLEALPAPSIDSAEYGKRKIKTLKDIKAPGILLKKTLNKKIKKTAKVKKAPVK